MRTDYTDDRPRNLRFAASGAVALACALALWWSFVVGEPIPLLTYVDFGVHEFGHMILMSAPHLATALAGSIAQIALPLGLAVYFGLFRREPIATALLLAWAGTSAQNVSVYIADAPYQYLPLWGNGLHDWAYILGTTGAMRQVDAVAGAVWALGLMLVIAGLVLAIIPVALELAAGHRETQLEAHRATLPRHDPRNPTKAQLRGLVPDDPEWRYREE